MPFFSQKEHGKFVNSAFIKTLSPAKWLWTQCSFRPDMLLKQLRDHFKAITAKFRASYQDLNWEFKILCLTFVSFFHLSSTFRSKSPTAQSLSSLLLQIDMHKPLGLLKCSLFNGLLVSANQQWFFQLVTMPLQAMCYIYLFKLNLLGWDWLIKLYRFQVYSSILHHLYIV